MTPRAIDSKKEVANRLLKLLSPHMSSQLGANLGYGVNTYSNDLLPQANEAIQLWLTDNNSSKLIATIMAANALGVIAEDQADDLIINIKKISKQDKQKAKILTKKARH